MKFPRPALVGLVAAWLLTLVGVLPPGVAPARAADYRLESSAIYTVRPNDREVRVTVRVDFRNTTPDPPGRFSVFEVIDLAIQDGARDVRANDRKGKLRVTVDRRRGVTVASVRPRDGVRYRDDASFTLHYVLPDGASDDVRIRPSLVVFPVWSFGTQGRVEVTLPQDYEVQVDGDALTAEQDGDRWRLASGMVEDPTRWLSLLTATQATSFATVTRSVQIDGQPLEIEVRAWSDDRAWGRRTADLAERAMPLLARQLGLTLDAGGPLVLVESLPSSGGELAEPAPAGTDVAIGFDEPPFTVLHQLAHAWVTPGVASDRWIREGIASLAAADVARRLDVEHPFDPRALADQLRDAAFPLVSWGVGEASATQDRFAYAASWHVARQLQDAVGADALRLALRRFAAGLDGYAPVDADLQPDTGLPALPADSRHLLDQLAAVSDADIMPIFRDWVLDEVSVQVLPDRAAAREAAADLADAAGEAGIPDPVRLALAGWRFDDAQAAVGEARAWLADRDALLEEMAAAGLTEPQRLLDEYRTGGGTSAARAELEAERELVLGYAAARQRSSATRSPIDAIGMVGRQDPAAMLDEAQVAFAEGDLVGAAELVNEVQDNLEQAGRDGLIRLVSLLLVLVAGVAGLTWLARRGGASGPDRYTAAP
jgi:hypothetical protein